MSTEFSNRRKHSNPIAIAPLAMWLLLALVVSACGLLFVYVKNQQHFLGARTREVEQQIRNAKAQNEVLLARISQLSSRAELQRKLDLKVIDLKAIEDHCIARLTPPAIAGAEGALRTAANERFRQ